MFASLTALSLLRKIFYRMGSAYRLHRRTCYTKKEPPRRISKVLKLAATSSPTISRSAVPSAMLSLCPVLSLLPSPLSAPLSPASARSASPARRRRAQPTPRMAHTAPHSATPPPMRHTYPPKNLPIPPDYIKDMVSLK